jgi:regulator of sirC expression with transglutaminase-like and TPR domain
MNKEEIKALITLLEDPDPAIYQVVRNKLLELGEEVIPYLEESWELHFDSLVQDRAERLIHQIQLNSLKKSLTDWLSAEEKNLLSAWIIISRIQYPGLDADWQKEQIKALQQQVWLELNEELTPLEHVKVINHFFFQIQGYKGDARHFHAPQNSLLKDVLDRKKGNPLSLSLLYTIICEQLDIPISGVNLPKHFLLAYTKRETAELLFYISPFSKGTILSREDLERFLQKENIKVLPSYLLPAPKEAIIKRLLNNLLHAYGIAGNKEKAEEVQELLQLFENH